MVIKKFTKLGRRMDEHTEHFNKEMENVRNYQIEVTDLKNIIIELKNTLDVFNSRLDKAEERISQLKDKAVELTHSEQQKEKNNEKSKDSLRSYGTASHGL